MNELGKALQLAIESAEMKEAGKKYALKYHLMPPIGWLNDPNGLCQFHGEYHVFFQYGPFDPKGGLKVWGHYASYDLLHWKYLGTPILPDEAWDCHGAYSGTALIDEDEMVIYYTGNVKFPGNYDYIHTGRGANTIKITSKDGRTFSKKQCVLSNKDYPDTYTNHIRDPKVIKKNGKYHMFLGGRKTSDHGAVLIYESSDKENWTYKNEITTKEAFGFMWECPNFIEFEESWFLVVSPQGLTRETFKYQNIYQSGYFKGSGDYLGGYELGEFVEWDMGFDFYAPQTFEDEKGRVLLIGWVGLPDIDKEYTNLTVEEGWQHALTVPRVITKQDDRLYQYPIEELKALRRDKKIIGYDENIVIPEGSFDLEVEKINTEDFKIRITSELILAYHEGVFTMTFTGSMGAGRKVRQAKINEIHALRILCDVSLLEVYINEGEYVFTTRFYNAAEELNVTVSCKEAISTLWLMNEMEVSKDDEKVNCNRGGTY